MYSRRAVKPVGATGSSLAVPGTVAREAVVDWVFWAMEGRTYPRVRGAARRRECARGSGVPRLGFPHALPATAPRPAAALRRPPRAGVRRRSAADVRADPAPGPLGPEARRALAAGLGDLQADQHRDLAGSEADGAGRSGSL